MTAGLVEPLARITVRMEYADGRVVECEVPNPGPVSMSVDADRMPDLTFDPAGLEGLIPPPSRKFRLEVQMGRAARELLTWKEIVR